MRTTTSRLFLLLPWLSLPLVAAVYLLLWNRIPERLAIHFDSAGNANNWMTRGQSLAFDLAVLAFILITSNLKIRRQSSTERNTSIFLLYLAVIFVTLVFFGLLKYNISGSLF